MTQLEFHANQGAQKARREHGLRNFTAKVSRCENRPLAAKWFHSRPSSSTKFFATAKWPHGTRVPFHSQVHPFRSYEMAASFPHLKIHHFRSRDAIWKGVSQLRNHHLAHECHFAAPVRPFRNCEMGCENCPPQRNPPPAAKMPFGYEMISQPQGTPCEIPYWLRNHHFGYETISKLQNGCENVSIFSMSYETPLWLRNNFAAP